MKKSILLIIFLIGFVLIGCSQTDPSLTVKETEVKLFVDETHKIEVTLEGVKGNPTVEYTSNSLRVAEVSDSGVITAKESGSANITVTVKEYEDLEVVIKVTVEDQLNVTGPESLEVGQTVTLTAEDKLDNGQGVVWVSANPEIATVNDNGEVTGVAEGTTTIEAHSAANGKIFEYEIEVTMAIVRELEIKSNIDGDRVKTTANLKLSANVLPAVAEQGVYWTTDDDSIADIDEDGNVTIRSFGTVTFTATSIQTDEVTETMTIEFYWDTMDLIDYIIVQNPVIAKGVKAIGYQAPGYYDVDVLGSVSNFYFGNYEAYERIAPINDQNRPGIKKASTEYVTIHDTASIASSAGAASHASYVYGGGGGTSWHYSIGNDGVWKQIPDDEIAYHAGDGSRTYGLNDTGVEATSKIKPKIEINASGYYTLNGERTLIKAPTDSEGKILRTSDINDYGITLEVGENGNWHIGNTYYNGTYKKIANHGGNRNSIGIETMVNKGSDLYLTWHYTAKKASELLIEFNLGFDRLKTHHFFSGKNCPQTLRDNGLFENFMKMAEAEYLVNKFLGDYTLTLTSGNQELVDNTGRILKIPEADTEVSIFVKVENNSGFNQTKTYKVVIPAK